MKIKHLLTKTLLVAAGLLMGMSAWADEVVLNPTADTWVDYKSTGDANANHGTDVALTAGVWQDMWSNGTPGLKNNNYGAFAMMKFDVSAYKGKISAASFKITATLGQSNNNRDLYIGYYTGTSWAEGTVTANNSGIVHRSATELNIGHLGTFATVTKNATAEYTCSTLSALVDYLNNDADGIVTLIFYTYTADISIASKEATTGKPTLTLTYTNETLYSATFNETNSLNPTVTVYTDAGRTSEIAYNQLSANTTYYYRAVLAGYENYEGSFAVATSNPTVNFTMTALPRYTFTVNLINSVGGAVIETLYTDDDSYDGKKHDVGFSKYLTDGSNRVTFAKDDDTYYTQYVSASATKTQTVSYTAYDGVAYFFEGESFAALGTKETNGNYSGNKAGRGLNNATLDIFTIPATGKYTLSYAVCSNNVGTGKETQYSFYKNNSGNVIEDVTDLNHSVNNIKTTGTRSVDNIAFAAGDVLQFYSKETKIILDYVLLTLNSVSTTITSAGWSTLYTPYALDFSTLSSEIEAYTATLSSTTVTLNKVDNVPANTGVVLKKIGGTGSYDIPVIASSSTPQGDLTGNASADTPYDAGTNRYYLALNGESKAQFKKLTSGSIAAGKAFLETAVTAPVLNVVLGDDNVTGIADVRSKMEDVRGNIFDLQGRKVAQPTKGLYIVNGKKIVVK